MCIDNYEEVTAGGGGGGYDLTGNKRIVFDTLAYCFCRWSGTGQLGLSHSLWLEAIAQDSLTQFLVT